MRVVFAGTPEFARQALEAILAAGHEVPLVMTQPDRPSGRGMKLHPSPVKEAALAHGIEVAQPQSLRLDGKYPEDAEAALRTLQAVQPDVMVVAAYGLILPQWVLDLPKYGCLNIHASLLPRWRGAAPIQRAIEVGDAQTGITIMQMDAGLDTGDMLLVRAMDIRPDHSGASLQDELTHMGAECIVEILQQLADGTAPTAVKQPEAGVTYAEKLLKTEAPLDFTQTAVALERRIRAFDPMLGSTMALDGIEGLVKVWRAQALPAATNGAEPGQILSVTADGIDVATAEGTLRITELQRPGSKRQPVSSFVQGWSRA